MYRGTAGDPSADPGHEDGEDAGDRLVEVEGDLLAELAGGVDGAGQGDVLDDGDAVGRRLLADAASDLATALGHDGGRAAAGLVADGHGDVRRVDDDGGGGG